MSQAVSPRRAHSDSVAIWRTAGRDVVVACASASVVAFLVFFAVAGQSSELSASVGPVVPRPGAAATVVGRVVGPTGDGIKGAEVVVRRSGMTPVRALADANGAFRMALRGECASYVVSLRAKSGGDTVNTSARRHLCPGDALPVDARVVTHGHFLWVPGPR